MEINLEIIIGSLALILSLISLYHQFFHKEIVIYPSMKNNDFYLNIENSGGTLVQNFSVEILNIDTVLSDSMYSRNDFQSRFKNQNGINGKSSITLAPKGKRTILLGEAIDFQTNSSEAIVPSYPIFSVKVSYKGFKKSKTFICDYNSYTNEIVPQDTDSILKELNMQMKLSSYRNR